MSLLLSTAMALQDIANTSADKILAATQDMEHAIPCALAGIELTACSPAIYGTNVTQQINDLHAVLDTLNNHQTP